MNAVLKVKKIGGSLAVIIPKKLVEKQNIKSEDFLRVQIEKTNQIKPFFGILKDKMSAKEFLREIDETENY